MFRIEYMTRKAYGDYMMGGYAAAMKVDIDAPTAELALGIAKAFIPGDVVFNENYIRKVEDIEKEEAERKARWEAEEAKKMAKKEWEKAHPEIMEERKRKAKIARCKREIRQAEEEMERLRRLIERQTAKLAELEG